MPESNLKIAVAGVPGNWSTESLADEIENRIGFRLVFDPADMIADVAGGKLWVGGYDLCSMDGIVVKKLIRDYSPVALDRIELLRVAEAVGVRVFSPCDAMARLIDRLACTVALRNAGIPLPPTVVTEDSAAALDAVRGFGRAVLKPLYSTKARGMIVVDGSREEAARAVRDFAAAHPVIYVQKVVDLPGRDLGLAFLGGKYFGAYARVRVDDKAWNTTTASGGSYQAVEPDDGLIELARRAQAPFHLDFTCVDIAETSDGPIVFEVSAFGGFRGLQEAARLDAAAAYAEHAVRELGAGNG
jgi:tetrahydromethanopterin:alpha-L-glutamate ligase